MKLDTSSLPDDPVELKKIIAQIVDGQESVFQQHESEKERLHNRYESLQCHYEQEIELLQEQLRQLFDKLFGRTSEKFFGKSPQLLLFDMPEIDPEPELARKNHGSRT